MSGQTASGPKYPPFDMMSYEEGAALARTQAHLNVGLAANPARTQAWANYKDDDLYNEINWHWRQGRRPTDDDLIRMSSYDEFVLTRDMQLYRGARATTQHGVDRLGGKRSGEYIDEPSYVSTSFTREEAEAFADNDPYERDIRERFILDIKAPPGTAFSPIDASENLISNEDELVLPPGTRFLLTGDATIDADGRVVYSVIPLAPGAPNAAPDDDPRIHAMVTWEIWNQKRRGQ